MSSPALAVVFVTASHKLALGLPRWSASCFLPPQPPASLLLLPQLLWRRDDKLTEDYPARIQEIEGGSQHLSKPPSFLGLISDVIALSRSSLTSISWSVEGFVSIFFFDRTCWISSNLSPSGCSLMRSKSCSILSDTFRTVFSSLFFLWNIVDQLALCIWQQGIAYIPKKGTASIIYTNGEHKVHWMINGSGNGYHE